VDAWLATTFGDDFEQAYSDAAHDWIDSDEALARDALQGHPTLLAEELKSLDGMRRNIESLFDINRHEEMINRGARRMSRSAILGMICIYSHRETFTVPYDILQALIDLDNGFSLWRYRHADLALRQLGFQAGSGGTSGVEYLRKTTCANKVFSDICNVASFLLPKSRVPPLQKR